MKRIKGPPGNPGSPGKMATKTSVAVCMCLLNSVTLVISLGSMMCVACHDDTTITTRACLDQHLIAIRSREVLGDHLQSKTRVIAITLRRSAALQTRPPTTDTSAIVNC